jgi:HTH-type transcriptional regulator / antitoxin HigA
MKSRTSSKSSRLPTSFDDLSELHALRPIQDKVDFENAQEIADQLAILDRRTRDQNDYLETLSTLMEKYENEHSPIETRDLKPVETLKYLMEAHDMSASDLGRLLGNRELGPAILRGDRQLSKKNIITLSEHFKLTPAVFLRG